MASLSKYQNSLCQISPGRIAGNGQYRTRETVIMNKLAAVMFSAFLQVGSGTAAYAKYAMASGKRM